MATLMDSYLDQTRTFGAARPQSLLRRVAEHAFRIVRDYRARRALRSLSDGMLADIGLRRGDVEMIGAEHWWHQADWQALERLRHGSSK